DWIAWTPEGYYAASAYGERLMGWQVNNGPDKLATYHPAARFHASLFQPDVIRFLIPEGSLARAVARASREGKHQVAGLNLTQVRPPKGATPAPNRGAAHISTDQATVEVKATATSTGDYPVTAMRLLVDGRPYQGQKGVKTFDPPKTGSVDVSWTVSLLPGKHVLAVQADSAVSKGLSQKVEATRTGGKQEELPNPHVLAGGLLGLPGQVEAELRRQRRRAAVHGVQGEVEGGVQQGRGQGADGQAGDAQGHPRRPGGAGQVDDGERRGGLLLQRPRGPRPRRQLLP